MFSALYPNSVWPNHGVFVKERVNAVARSNRCDLRVIAPIPYYPPIDAGWRAAYNKVAESEIIDGIRVDHPRYFMIPKIAMPLQGLTLFASLLPVARRTQKEFAFDVIDAHYIYPDGFAAVLLGRVFDKPVVVSARGSDVNEFAKYPIVRRLIKFTLAGANHVVAVSDALRARILEMGISPGKVSLIANGVDTAKFNGTDKREARLRVGLGLDRPIVLSVGGLNPVKGFDLLIRSFKLLLDRTGEPKPYLVIVGEGPVRRDLEVLIAQSGLQNDVRLAGAVAHESLHRWYSAADVFCLASRSEGRPNVLLEALACGVPVVAPPVGGIPEIINSDTIGLLPERRAESIADSLRSALMRQWDPRQLRNHAELHRWESTATRVVDVFETVRSQQPLRPRDESADESRV